MGLLEFLEGNYQESIRIYRSLLKEKGKDETTKRAVVINMFICMLAKGDYQSVIGFDGKYGKIRYTWEPEELKLQKLTILAKQKEKISP